MNIACIGTGFVGVVTASVFAKLGNNVIGLDIDEEKIAKLKQGIVPFYEPGLSELLFETQSSQALIFTTDYKTAIKDADLVMIMVGTPSSADGSADLTYLTQATTSIAPYLKENVVVVVKSTVPPGTNAEIRKLISSLTQVTFHMASVPEFLKEGTAVSDTLHPDRIVLGVEDEYTKNLLIKLHTPLTQNILVMSPESAQMTKYAANNYLATRITFINQIADLCISANANIEEVIQGIGADKRIGPHYWYPGLGYGGSCFPKDVKELSAYAKKVGENDSLFIHIDRLNSTRINKILDQVEVEVGGFAGKTVTVLGLAFKPNTNDTREAPANYMLPYLKAKGAIVVTVDPQVESDTKDPYLAAKNAHVIILTTEWQEYKTLDLAKIKSLMQSPFVFFDTRNLYDPMAASAVGLKYLSIGRK